MHGRGREESSEEMYFGVHEELLYAKKIQPLEGIDLCLMIFIKRIRLDTGIFW